MAMNRYARLWKLMSEHDFKNSDDIPDDLLCILCGKLMIEPYATDCGCQFCKKCINDYLHNERKHCPGSREACKANLLEMEVSVSKDLKTRNTISKTKVKCPNNGCTFTKELESIDDHIRLCKMGPVACPFQTIGCADAETTGDNIHNHLQHEAFAHSQLLLDAINNLRNDVNGMADAPGAREEVMELRDENTVNKRELETQRREINQLKQENLTNKQEIVEQRREILRLKEVMERSQRDNIAIKDDVSGIKAELIALKMDAYQPKAPQTEMEIRLKEEIEKIKKEFCDLKKEINGKGDVGELKKQLEKQNQELNSVKSKASKCAEDIEKMNSNKMEGILNVVHDFVWLIKDFSKKKGEHFSDIFSTNNYTFCLRAWFGTGNVWLFVCVRRGGRDDKAEWPIKHSVTLSVMNQSTLRPFVSERYSAATCEGESKVFNKPINDTDGRIGNLQVSLADLKALRGLLVSDSLMVCCSLMPNAR